MIVEAKGKLLKWITNVKTYPFDRAQIKKIVILRYDRIGDMIVSLPLCKALKFGIPGVEIVVIASKVNACIAQGSNFIDRTVIKPNGLFEWINRLLLIRSEQPDLAIDLNHAVTPHTIFAIRIMRPKHVASPFKDGRWGVLGTDLKLFDLMPKQHPKKYYRPIAETYLDIARLLDCPTDGCIPYPLPHYAKSQNNFDNYVILNLSGSRPSMQLQEPEIEAIVNHIHSLDPTLQILIPTMQEHYEKVYKKYKCANTVSILTPSSSIMPLLKLIQFSRLVITPDTALVHIASAYQTPLVAIYSKDMSLFTQWQPYPPPNASVIHSNEAKGLKGYSIAKLLALVTQELVSSEKCTAGSHQGLHK